MSVVRAATEKTKKLGRRIDFKSEIKKMKIEAILTPSELAALARRDLRGTACVVFDVLRATSAFVTALRNGANAVIPAAEISEALATREKQPDVLLAGERNGVKIRAARQWHGHPACETGASAEAGNTQAGSPCHYSTIDFDLGNSPREFTPEMVRGRTIVSTTTNGTRALRACVHAQTVLAGSFLNLGATAEFIQRLQPAEVLLVCAGTRENRADEDVLAAGALCELLAVGSSRCDDRTARRAVPTQISDSAEIARRAFAQAKSDLAAAVHNSENGRRLLAIPELRDDVAFCLQRDIFPLVARMEADGAIRQP
jgi:2-phosphosulfolactate phosphatase